MECPIEIAGDSGTISGSVTVMSKTDRDMLTLDVEFEEAWKTVNIPSNSFMRSRNRLLKHSREKRGALGALRKLGGAIGGEKSTFQLSACLDLKGVALDPSKHQNVRVN